MHTSEFEFDSTDKKVNEDTQMNCFKIHSINFGGQNHYENDENELKGSDFNYCHKEYRNEEMENGCFNYGLNYHNEQCCHGKDKNYQKNSADKCCGVSGEHSKYKDLARAYVPEQKMRQLSSPIRALKEGTAFPELYMPYKKY